jgi:hypothetical protein
MLAMTSAHAANLWIVLGVLFLFNAWWIEKFPPLAFAVVGGWLFGLAAISGWAWSS